MKSKVTYKQIKRKTLLKKIAFVGMAVVIATGVGCASKDDSLNTKSDLNSTVESTASINNEDYSNSNSEYYDDNSSKVEDLTINGVEQTSDKAEIFKNKLFSKLEKEYYVHENKSTANEVFNEAYIVSRMSKINGFSNLGKYDRYNEDYNFKFKELVIVNENYFTDGLQQVKVEPEINSYNEIWYYPTEYCAVDSNGKTYCDINYLFDLKQPIKVQSKSR